MSIDIAAIEAGITLDRDVPVVSQRKVKDWAKLIGMARKLEAQEDTALNEERRRNVELAAQLAAMSAKLTETQTEVFRLREESAKLHLSEKLTKLDVSVKDRNFLLGVES